MQNRAQTIRTHCACGHVDNYTATACTHWKKLSLLELSEKKITPLNAANELSTLQYTLEPEENLSCAWLQLLMNYESCISWMCRDAAESSEETVALPSDLLDVLYAVDQVFQGDTFKRVTRSVLELSYGLSLTQNASKDTHAVPTNLHKNAQQSTFSGS